MGSSFDAESIAKLKHFVHLCMKNPAMLSTPQLAFFKQYIESMGGTIPSVVDEEQTTPPSGDTYSKPSSTQMPDDKNQESSEDDEEEDNGVESDVSIDNEGCIDPDIIESSQEMGDVSKVVTEEEETAANEKYSEAMCLMAEKKYLEAVPIFTEAIKLNPCSATLYTKRGQAYLNINRPNACILDCTRALELNPDSAPSYRLRGKANRLVGEWVKAANDLRQACNIDYDEQTDEWLKEVTPNAKKLEEHNLKKQRNEMERGEREKARRLRKVRDAHAKARQQQQQEAQHEKQPSGGGQRSFVDSLGDLARDPDITEALKDAEICQAFKDIQENPGSIGKYLANPKFQAIIKKLMPKMGMEAGFPPGGGFPPPQPPSNSGEQKPSVFDDGNLD